MRISCLILIVNVKVNWKLFKIANWRDDTIHLHIYAKVEAEFTFWRRRFIGWNVSHSLLFVVIDVVCYCLLLVVVDVVLLLLLLLLLLFLCSSNLSLNLPPLHSHRVYQFLCCRISFRSNDFLFVSSRNKKNFLKTVDLLYTVVYICCLQTFFYTNA